LLGHVAEPQASLPIDRPAAPANLSAIGPREAEDAAHRRGLPRAVRAEEADDPPGARGERRPVESDDVAVALGEIDDVEHVERHDAVNRTTPGQSFDPGSWRDVADARLDDERAVHLLVQVALEVVR